MRRLTVKVLYSAASRRASRCFKPLAEYLVFFVAQILLFGFSRRALTTRPYSQQSNEEQHAKHLPAVV